ncbi:aldolase/citrate lyase family protein [Lichenihabitans sp. Uapishka_5]|uniref:aldolase/citrate lyase family protein n=1 Tax=Lichenihabitans sp. Uapishka_5 TaxID=3037302 RepID=UPI0029E7E122|nr:aldolase/citrate lyase family protein [Lichenihabitans sp. Uapishka_5]MDX7950155.1 aldolase/citrate lyase family protein [Lichenihabitans sp. Uapishka_5]
MRSLLLVPMDETSAIDRAVAAGADALVLDLAASGQDASARERARLNARDVLRAAQLWPTRPLLYVRVENLEDAALGLDLAAVMIGEPDGVLLAGSRSGADVQHLGAKLAVFEAEHGLSDGETGIIAGAGARAKALFSLGSYVEASPRLVGLTWSAEDLAADLGSRHDGTALPGPLETMRHFTLFAARAAEVAAIDSASMAPDRDAFLAECRAARAQGFNAKLATTPEAVAVINAVFGHEDP